MDNSSEYASASPASTAAAIRSLIDSVPEWLDNFLDLVVLEGKKAGIGLVLGFGVGAAVLLITSWLAPIARAVAACKDLLFSAPRRQLGLKSASTPSHA